MEVENVTETVNLKETITPKFSNRKRAHEMPKQVFEKAISDTSNHHQEQTSQSDHHPDSILELSNESHEKNETESPSKMTDRTKVIRENLKALSEKYEVKMTDLLSSNVQDDIDEIFRSGPDRESPKDEISPNEDSSEVPSSEVLDDCGSLDSRRTRRKSKRKLGGDFCCPVCGLTVREPELESHYAQEVEKLTKVSSNMMRLRPRKSDGINTTYVQVKCNRENRLTAKVAKYAVKATKEVQCPICKLRLSGSEEDINRHVVLCVENDDYYDEHIVVDDDDDQDTESFEEYEIGDQVRIRPISMVSGGYRTLEGPTSKRNRADENEELEVDVDDTVAYGEPHELDVIPNSTDVDSAELRKAFLGNEMAHPHVFESRKWGDIVNAKLSTEVSSDLATNQLSPSDSLNTNKSEKNDSKDKIEAGEQTVNSLKERIKDLEDQNRNVKCLICMESYTKPVVSTTCWHVHCEECWLMTMGVKKLCPQCNMIVFPSDLRKIYL